MDTELYSESQILKNVNANEQSIYQTSPCVQSGDASDFAILKLGQRRYCATTAPSLFS